MAFVKKYCVWGIFISILSIFAMSYNANAIDFNINLDNYNLIRHSDNLFVSCRLDGQALTAGAQYCQSSSTTPGIRYLSEIRYNGDYSFADTAIQVGDYLEWYVVVETEANYSLNAMFKGPLFIRTYDYLQTYSFEQISMNEFLTYVTSTNNLPGENVGFINDFWSGRKIYNIYRVVQRVISKPQDRWTFGFNTTSSSQHIFEWYEVEPNIIRFRIMNFNQYRFVGSEENKEVEEKTQEAVNESQSAGSSSSSSASQGGANLLTAITGFFNVITSAQPSNCRFNAPLNTYFGNERLNVDLCALDLPNGIGALTSIIAIGILIPFAIHMFNKFIALFRSFQS